MQQKFAHIVSRLFEPFILLATATIFGGVKSGLRGRDLLLFFLLVTVMVGVPVLLQVWAVQTKRISDWDISRRKERIIPFAVAFLLFIFDGILVLQFNNIVLNQLFFLYLLWFFGFFLITLFWKISGHVGVAALATGLVASWYGSFWIFALGIVPIIGWARMKTKNHTFAQVLGAALYSWIVIAVMLH
ncbi:MAG: hypothetical protein Q7S76_03525 [bacterium]|nr:hypothetical protein [bacterium]